MATRFYLSSTATVTQTPAFEAWTRVTEALRRAMSPIKDGSAATSTTIWANGTVNADETALARQFVSEPMAAGIAFSTTDTIKCQVRCFESAANDNINRQPIAVKVYSQDGTTLQATLKALGHIGPNTTEWSATSLRNKTVADGDTLGANYTTVLGDILVIEIGGQVSSAGGVSVTGTMSFGSDSATDLGENETDTAANNPWFEISRTVSLVTIVSPANAAFVTSTFAPTIRFTSIVTPAPATLVTATFAPKLALTITPSTQTLLVSSFAPVLNLTVIPSTGALALATFAPNLHEQITPATSNLSLTSFAPSLSLLLTVIPDTASLTITLQNASLSEGVIPATTSLVIATFRPTILPFHIVFLDPGGDSTQAVGHFNTDINTTGLITYDTAQEVVGVGSYKLDSDDGTLEPVASVPGVLGLARRVSFYWRYDSLPDNTATVSEFCVSTSIYSGGGFDDPSSFNGDDGVYSFTTPPKNAGQGNKCSIAALLGVPIGAVIDSVKIIYERKYDVNTSIGISRVKWVLNGVEGPNHDNTDMPLVDTVVEVDITTEYGWTWQDFASGGGFEVIAEARRGDTDTAHTQSWDYVKVEVVLHLANVIMQGMNADSTAVIFQIAVTPKGSGVCLRFADAEGDSFDGITPLLPNLWHRISFGYVLRALDDLDLNLYVNGLQELAIEEAATTITTITNLEYGWIVSPGVDHLCWFDQLYIDDGDDLSDPGDMRSTHKGPATVNENNWNATGGTGAVDERPLSETNFKQHTASTGARQTYTLQNAATGDVDLTGETLVGHLGWAWAKKGAGDDGDLPALIVNNTVQPIILTTSPKLFKFPVTSTIYPSHAAGIGMRSNEESADTFMYETGAAVAYAGPDTNPNRLLAYQLLAEDSITNITDDLRGDPQSSYELGYNVAESDALVFITVYAVSSEGHEPQLQALMGTQGGSGRARIDSGIEVQVVIEVTGGSTMVGIRRFLNVD